MANSLTKDAVETRAAIAVSGANDVRVTREGSRQKRLLHAALMAAAVTAPISAWLFFGSPIPQVDPFLVVIVIFFGLMIAMVFLQTKVSGGSPHTLLSPEQISIGFDDVKGIGPVKAEVKRALDLFLAHAKFKDQMGGRAPRGILFEGPPGTGKTHMAKAMAREAGVPFLFLSATSIQSMWHGGSAKKIRSFFKELRRVARTEGGAIGFIEEIDAIAMKRGGMGMTAMPSTPMQSSIMCCGGLDGLPVMNASNGHAHAAEVNQAISSEGSGGMVNELLVQMQSFDEPYGFRRFSDKFISRLNAYLPENRRIKLKPITPANILIIAATNRADSLDPALLRPGRFDKRLAFDAPSKAGRRELIDYFLNKKAHDAGMATDERRDALAAITTGYTPVMLENLFDEALIQAVFRDATEMSWRDIEHARMLVTVGIGQPVEYTDFEEKLIASHEAGHATVAWLVAPQRRLEVLTIIKRKNALGLLAHGDAEDVYTRQRSEMLALIQTALGGQVAEELLFGDVSTGPAGDLSYATTVAAQMVGAAGMVNSLISIEAAGGGMMDSNLTARVISSPMGREAVENILSEAKRTVRELLTENLDRVEALRDALVERKELIGHEITDVLESVGPRPTVEPFRLMETV